MACQLGIRSPSAARAIAGFKHLFDLGAPSTYGH
jgi:hypothetical protein